MLPGPLHIQYYEPVFTLCDVCVCVCVCLCVCVSVCYRVRRLSISGDSPDVPT